MSNKPKPHPHAELIKAWADGAEIQYWDDDDNKWRDCKGYNGFPTWDVELQYRVKPEEPSDEPWKPKKREKYFFWNVIDGESCVDCNTWDDDEIDNALYRLHNIFHTKEEVESAIPRVEAALKAALKGTTDVSANVGSPEIDGKPMTGGEKALIKAIRAVKIARIPEYRTSVLCFPSENTNTVQVWCSDTPIAFLTSSLGGISKDKAIIDALKQIKAEQEASNETK